MNRKAKLALALIVLNASTALASEGLYTGISIGRSSFQANIHRDTSDNLTYFSNSGTNGTAVGAFLGYNHLLTGSPLFIGLEGGVQSHNLKAKINQSYGNNYFEKMDTKVDHSLFGVFKFGVVVNELMVYGKAGAFKSKVRLSYSSNYPSCQPFERLIKTNAYGSVYGFGVDFKVNPNWGIGLDHTVNTYSSIEFKLPNGNAGVDPVVNLTSLRLTYTF